MTTTMVTIDRMSETPERDRLDDRNAAVGIDSDNSGYAAHRRLPFRLHFTRSDYPVSTRWRRAALKRDVNDSPGSIVHSRKPRR